MLPAERPCLSFKRTSVREVHVVWGGKKNVAACSAMIQSSRNRTGQVIVKSSLSKMLHVPKGSLALSFVQFGTLLLNGHRRWSRYRRASDEWLSTGNPKISARGC